MKRPKRSLASKVHGRGRGAAGYYTRLAAPPVRGHLIRLSNLHGSHSGSEPAWGSNALCPLAALPCKRPNIGSRMNREVHMRICERPEVRVPSGDSTRAAVEARLILRPVCPQLRSAVCAEAVTVGANSRSGDAIPSSGPVDENHAAGQRMSLTDVDRASCPNYGATARGDRDAPRQRRFPVGLSLNSPNWSTSHRKGRNGCSKWRASGRAGWLLEMASQEGRNGSRCAAASDRKIRESSERQDAAEG